MNVYESIIQGLNEAVEFEKGNVKARTAKCTVTPVPDLTSAEIRDIRLSFGMTQATFAEVEYRYGVTKTAEEGSFFPLFFL